MNENLVTRKKHLNVVSLCLIANSKWRVTLMSTIFTNQNIVVNWINWNIIQLRTIIKKFQQYLYGVFFMSSSICWVVNWFYWPIIQLWRFVMRDNVFFIVLWHFDSTQSWEKRKWNLKNVNFSYFLKKRLKTLSI